MSFNVRTLFSNPASADLKLNSERSHLIKDDITSVMDSISFNLKAKSGEYVPINIINLTNLTGSVFSAVPTPIKMAYFILDKLTSMNKKDVGFVVNKESPGYLFSKGYRMSMLKEALGEINNLIRDYGFTMEQIPYLLAISMYGSDSEFNTGTVKKYLNIGTNNPILNQYPYNRDFQLKANKFLGISSRDIDGYLVIKNSPIPYKYYIFNFYKGIIISKTFKDYSLDLSQGFEDTLTIPDLENVKIHALLAVKKNKVPLILWDRYNKEDLDLSNFKLFIDSKYKPRGKDFLETWENTMKYQHFTAIKSTIKKAEKRYKGKVEVEYVDNILEMFYELPQPYEACGIESFKYLFEEDELDLEEDLSF
jgi:hypothetical protein